MDPMEALLEIQSEGLGELMPEYSGRGMFGKTCPGIATDRPIGVIERAGSLGVFGAVMDDMGKQTVVYWPRFRAAPAVPLL